MIFFFEADTRTHDESARSSDWGPVPAGIRYLSGRHNSGDGGGGGGGTVVQGDAFIHRNSFFPRDTDNAR